MLSLFVVLTTEGWWGDFAQPVMEEIPAMAFFFVIFLVSTSFAMLNVLQALIVESTLATKKESNLEEAAKIAHSIDEANLEKLREVFNIGDEDGSGQLSVKEVKGLVV